MFGLTRWNSFDDVFNFQRGVDRLFNQFWSDLPTSHYCRQLVAIVPVHTTDDGWRVDVPMPGIDPKDVSLEVAGNNLTIRAEVPTEGNDKNVSRYEQTSVDPQFLDLEKLTAAHRHGMLRLTLPLKESVKPRRVQIETQMEDQKQLAGCGSKRSAAGFELALDRSSDTSPDADVFAASFLTAHSTGSAPLGLSRRRQATLLSCHVHASPAIRVRDALSLSINTQIWRTNHAEHTSLRLGLRGRRVCLPDGSAGFRAASRQAHAVHVQRTCDAPGRYASRGTVPAPRRSQQQLQGRAGIECRWHGHGLFFTIRPSDSSRPRRRSRFMEGKNPGCLRAHSTWCARRT